MINRADEEGRRCVAFAGGRRIAAGAVDEVADQVRAFMAGGEGETVLLFDAETSEPVEIDLRKKAGVGLRRVAAVARGPGRPRLGVVAKEVTLLPRHWDWLAAQPGGASVVLRRLVEAARRQPDPQAVTRRAQDSAYRFMSAMAGNERGFEEATRALFRGDRQRFEREVATWPKDLREHALELARPAFRASPGG